MRAQQVALELEHVLRYLGGGGGDGASVSPLVATNSVGKIVALRKFLV